MKVVNKSNWWKAMRSRWFQVRAWDFRPTIFSDSIQSRDQSPAALGTNRSLVLESATIAYLQISFHYPWVIGALSDVSFIENDGSERVCREEGLTLHERECTNLTRKREYCVEDEDEVVGDFIATAIGGYLPSSAGPEAFRRSAVARDVLQDHSATIPRTRPNGLVSRRNAHGGRVDAGGTEDLVGGRELAQAAARSEVEFGDEKIKPLKFLWCKRRLGRKEETSHPEDEARGNGDALARLGSVASVNCP
ncbi:hypothetical protein B0H16DRAFT_1455716 [Mycena metata]|uniref:Uncharacterized protein n=1 Tax=Mycena metata TaxID=1033252 RepID=A0AAD7JF33_9AGAR|nr:hypothetical protein B0H16DRAFT_1455716 [Mycena metata]